MPRNIASDLKFEIEHVCGGCGSGVVGRSPTAELEQPEQIAERNGTESPEAECEAEWQSGSEAAELSAELEGLECNGV